MKAAIILLLSAGALSAQLLQQPLLLAPQPIQPLIAPQQPTANQAVSEILNQMSRQQSQLETAAALTAPPTVIRYAPQQPVIRTGK